MSSPRISGKALVALSLLAASVLGLIAYQALTAGPDSEAAVAALAARIPAAPPNPFDAARELVEEHSIHRVNDEFRELRDRKGFAAAVAAKVEGKRVAPVPMECSSRSNLVGAILRAKGYRTRTVSLFDTESTKSHTMVDVLNPDTNGWESQDPDYGFYWRSRATQKRVSIADAAENLDDLQPCRGEVCGWEIRGKRGARASKIKALMDILTVTDKETGLRFAVYTSRAGHAKADAFCRSNAKRCHGGIKPASGGS